MSFFPHGITSIIEHHCSCRYTFASMKLAQKLAVNYIRARLNFLAVFSKKRTAKKALQIFSTPFYKTRKKLPAVFDSGTAVTIHLRGIALRGFKWNQGGIKRVLLLHGFESSVINFDEYIKALIKKNYEVLAFDAPAHGLSGGKQITLPLYAYMIETLYYKFGGIQSFMAHSFGGLAAAHALEKLPVDEDTRLALIAPATETTSAIDRLFHFLQLGEGVRAEFDKLILEEYHVDASYFSIPRALKQVKAAVLWVHDKDDDTTPFSDVEPVIHAGYPNLSFFITHGLGHKKIYRDERVIKKVVDFL